jgi:DNA-binding CsgD family transcriptional regulator
MVDASHALEVIRKIYDAALSPTLWNSALEAASDRLHGAGLNIPIINEKHSARRFLGTARLDPDCGARFLNDPIYVEPSTRRWMPILGGSPIGRVFYREEIWNDREYRMSAIFNDIIRPQKLWHWAFVPLVLDRGVFVPLGILRKPGAPLFDDDDRHFLTSLLPHFARALQVSLRLEVLRDEAATMEELIERLALGVILVDAAGAVVQTNGAAETVLSAADGLGIQHRQLTAANAAEMARLRRMIAAVASTAHGSGTQSGGTMALSRPSGKPPLSLLVAPLRSEDSPLETLGVQAIIFVSDPDRRSPPPTQLLARLFGLTPRQAALLQRLAEGDNLTDAAQALGITRNTARSHLRLIFDKTGTRRQSELARLFTFL